MRPFSWHTTAAVCVAAATALTSGCASREDALLQRKAGSVGADVALGATYPAAGVQGLTLLVVGDSWARNLGVGLADADRARRNVVVNAGEPGCGVMQPARIQEHGKMVPAPDKCNRWPQQWRDLVARYRPTAVLLEVGYWDGQDSQQMPEQEGVTSITDPAFRTRFDSKLDQAIRILGAGGARVYLPTVIDNAGSARANSDAMNTAVRAAVRRNSDTRLLDLHAQLCTTTKICPSEVRGIQVYDETGHPSSRSRKRLGAWILNAIHGDLHAGEKDRKTPAGR
jgi:hypothetical protein